MKKSTLLLLLILTFSLTPGTKGAENIPTERSARNSESKSIHSLQIQPDNLPIPVAADIPDEGKEVNKKAEKQGVQRRTVFLTVLLVIVAIFIPPLAVLFVDGLRPPFWLSILLTLLFYVPGLIYALFRVFKSR